MGGWVGPAPPKSGAGFLEAPKKIFWAKVTGAEGATEIFCLADGPENSVTQSAGGRAVLNGKKKEKKKCSGTSFPKKSPRALHVLNHGWWRLAVGGWRLAVGNWRLVAVGGGWRRLVVVGGGWQWLAVGGWRLVAAGSWRRLVVGGWWRLAVGGSWRLAVGGPLRAVLKGGP